MVGVFVLLPGLICFAVTLLLGIALTVIGFAVCRIANLEGKPAKVWTLTAVSTIVCLAIILSFAVGMSSNGMPTAERYKEMTVALALWLSVPGAALFNGGISLFILRIRGRNISESQVNCMEQ